MNSTGEECKPTSECQANCILDASCGEINDAVQLKDNALTKCLNDCR